MLSVNTAFDGEQGPALSPHPFSADTQGLKTTAERQHGARCCAFIHFVLFFVSDYTDLNGLVQIIGRKEFILCH